MRVCAVCGICGSSKLRFMIVQVRRRQEVSQANTAQSTRFSDRDGTVGRE